MNTETTTAPEANEVAPFEYCADYSRFGDINNYLGDIIGDKFREYRRQWELAHSMQMETDYPPYLSLETQLKCNYRCAMCMYSNGEELKKQYYPEYMSDEMFDKIINESSKHYCPSIGLNTMNEPLLDKKIAERIQKAYQGGFIDLRINTNASLLTEEMSEKIIKAGLTRLLVSLDAFSKETYEKVRIGGDYDNVFNNVNNFLRIREKLGEKLPVLRLSFVKLVENSHEIKDFLDYWTPKAELVTIQEYKPPIHKKVYMDKRSKDRKTGTVANSCANPFERLMIRGNGDVNPCCAQYAYKLKLGNIRDNTLYELWHSEKIKHLRKELRAGTWRSHPVCGPCLTNAHFS